LATGSPLKLKRPD